MAFNEDHFGKTGSEGFAMAFERSEDYGEVNLGFDHSNIDGFVETWVVAGSATEGEDFIGFERTRDPLGSGVPWESPSVRIIDDDIPEDAESFSIFQQFFRIETGQLISGDPQEFVFRIIDNDDDFALTLDLIEEPISLVEGEEAPLFSFTLTYAAEFDIRVRAELVDPAGQDDIELSAGIIPAGTKAAALQLIEPLKDDNFEVDEYGQISLRADGPGGPVPFSLGGVVATEHVVSLQLTDRVFAGLEDDATLGGLSAANQIADRTVIFWRSALERLKVPVDEGDYFEELIGALRDGELNNGLVKIAQDYVDDIVSATGLAIDGAEIVSNFSSRLDRARATATAEEHASELYLAFQGLAIDVADAAGRAAFATGSVGFAAGLATGLLGLGSVAALPATLALGIPIVVGWAGTIVYDEYVSDLVKTSAAQGFSQTLSLPAFLEALESIADNPDLSIRSESNSDGEIAASQASELFIASAGVRKIVGVSEELNGDYVTGFGPDDEITILGASFGVDQALLRSGSTIIEIDENGDGLPDIEISLIGEDPPETVF